MLIFPCFARGALVLPLLLTAACASLPVDSGRGAVTAELHARGVVAAASAEPSIAAAFSEPLTLDSAIHLALLHNPELRAEYARLGLASADVYEAGRLSNPVLSLARLDSSESGMRVSAGLVFNFTELLFLRARGRIADAEFAATQAEVAHAVLALAAEVESAYRELSAATQAQALSQTLADGATAAATLAQRFFDAGNLTRADLAREQAAAAEARLRAADSQLRLQNARASLLRSIGVSAGEAGETWTLAEPLAAPQGDEPALDALLAQARETRLDLLAAQAHADAIAARYGIERKQRWFGDIELGAEREHETDGETLIGPSASFSLPIFDWGKGRVARGRAAMSRAEAQVRARSLDIEQDVRGAWLALGSARARVDEYRQALIPARETVLAQMQREQNYMLIDVFELLAARADYGRAGVDYLDTLRDYWLARAQLSRAVGRRLPMPATESPPTDAPANTEAPAHHHHHEAQP